MSEQVFSADCTRCFGLCCTLLSFERSADFGHDKFGGQPCQYLRSDFRCRIHERLDDLGYGGCDAFDCLGAGQRASAAFAPLNWQRDAAVARRLQARFAQLLSLQEVRTGLAAASGLELSADQNVERQRLLAEVGADAESAASDVTPTGDAAIRASRLFLRQLGREGAA